MKLIVLGGGAYSRTLQDVAEQLGFEILAVLDDKDANHPLHSFTEYLASYAEFIPAFGNNEFRLKWIDELQSAGAEIATLIHPTAYISPKATIAEGTVILPHAIVNTGTVVQRGCIINLGAIVDHDCVLESGVHLAPGAIVKGENVLERCMKVESGEIIERGQYPR